MGPVPSTGLTRLECAGLCEQGTEMHRRHVVQRCRTPPQGVPVGDQWRLNLRLR